MRLSPDIQIYVGADIAADKLQIDWLDLSSQQHQPMPLAQHKRDYARLLKQLTRQVAPAHIQVVMEATGNPYTEYARISSHTGIPTVLGWGNHEGLWRSNAPEVAARIEDVRGFYSATDPAVARGILDKHHVNLVIVGDLERSTYPNAPQIAAFPFLHSTVSGNTMVFRVEPLR